MVRDRIDQIGPWSEVKLDILREYAGAYMTVLSKQKFIRRVVYIDAFAGAGEHFSKSKGQLVPGSPVNALNIRPAFNEYHFIDLDRKRVDRLEDIAKGIRDVHVHHNDCNQVLLDQVFPRCQYQDFARGLCLLDPYKLAVDWRVLATAGAMKSIEIFYNFMIMDANMNMFFRNPNDVLPSEIERMNAVWGDESWRQVAYRKTRGLFEELDEKRSNEHIAEAFRKRLEQVAGFKYVPQPVPMRNSTGAVVYYLYFASPNPIGSKIVTDIFEKYRKGP